MIALSSGEKLKAIAAVSLAVLCACSPPLPHRSVVASPAVIELNRDYEPPEFARAVEVRPFKFPADHGPHYEYQTEWWYYTGNLWAEDGDRFGYQFTIFRRGLSPGTPRAGEGLVTNQVYFAHLALTDIERETHRYDERFSRGAGGLAGARAEPFEVHIEDWSVRSHDIDAGKVHLSAASSDFNLDLELEAVKPLVKHGVDGLSAKSDQVGNASYYLSFTRMDTLGTLSLDGREFEVQGSSWFDHEWSTSVLGRGAVGWDWFGLQFDDGRELMLYQIRRSDGSVDAVSGGTMVGEDGEAHRLSAQEIQVLNLGAWTSEESGATYPSGWRILIPSLELTLEVEPWIDDQEMEVSFTYWEGAVQVRGAQGGKEFFGNGYVELTGYLESMEGVLS